MQTSRNFVFLYTLRGVDCLFEAVTKQSDGWFCRVVNGPMIGEELVINSDIVEAGRLRLASSNKMISSKQVRRSDVKISSQ